jgi:hypothetical protein
MIETLTKAGLFLLEHADLLDEIQEVITSGVSKESVKKAIRALKVKVSDEALKEELGLK